MSTMDPAAVRAEYLPRLEANLFENVLPFWYPRCLDESGGYRCSYDERGVFAGNDDKMIVTQARMTWLFSRLARLGYGDGEYRWAAEVGYDFLTGELWDDAEGGFYWEVDGRGTPTKPNKHVYGQAFGLYALAEYYRATGDPDAEGRARELFELLESVAHDDVHGGYREYFTTDWTPVESGRTYLQSIEPDWSPKESSDEELDPTMKLLNTHLHVLEATTAFYRATGDPDARNRLAELLTILTNTVVRTDPTACTDKYDRDWTPRLDTDSFRVVSYGHDLETVWLTMGACEALDVPPGLLAELYESLFDYTLQYGYDGADGGFYFYGPVEEPATNRVKAWWVQAEGMTAALKLYELTGDSRYLSVFTETVDFVEAYQTDWEHGEWYSGVDEDGTPLGRKGAEYKGAYHNGRALLECIHTLEGLPG
jgi:mannobiose 2-epimerase